MCPLPPQKYRYADLLRRNRTDPWQQSRCPSSKLVRYEIIHRCRTNKNQARRLSYYRSFACWGQMGAKHSRITSTRGASGYELANSLDVESLTPARVYELSKELLIFWSMRQATTRESIRFNTVSLSVETRLSPSFKEAFKTAESRTVIYADERPPPKKLLTRSGSWPTHHRPRLMGSI